MLGVGAASGLVYGGTNVGVQLVAYLRSCDLSHALFVGVTALVFLGLNAVRVMVAAALGRYPDLSMVVASLGAAVPAMIGVAIGRRLRHRLAPRHRRRLVLSLLSVVGVQLLRTGACIA